MQNKKSFQLSQGRGSWHAGFPRLFAETMATPPDTTAPGGTPPTAPMDTTTLRERLDEAGYMVLDVRETERGLVWRLAPHLSQVEFEVVGNDEVRRFLAHL